MPLDCAHADHERAVKGRTRLADKKEMRCVCELVSYLKEFIASLAWRDEFIWSLAARRLRKNMVSSTRAQAHPKSLRARCTHVNEGRPPQFCLPASSCTAYKAVKREGMSATHRACIHDMTHRWFMKMLWNTANPRTQRTHSSHVFISTTEQNGCKLHIIGILICVGYYCVGLAQRCLPNGWKLLTRKMVGAYI